MGATTPGEITEREDGAVRGELERGQAELIGAFAAPDGEHRCLLAYAGEEALVYDLPPRGPALCLL